jgi:regulatory protein spx
MKSMTIKKEFNLRKMQEEQVVIYGSLNCSSTRKALKWLRSKKLKYVFRDLDRMFLGKDEFSILLSFTDDGVTDILATRSKYWKKIETFYLDAKLSDLYEILEVCPSLLKRPILVSNRKAVVGFRQGDYEVFVPRDERKVKMLQALYLLGVDGL